MYSPPPRPFETPRRHTTELVSSIEVNTFPSFSHELRSHEKFDVITSNHRKFYLLLFCGIRQRLLKK